MKKIFSKEKGFTLLFAVLVSTLILSIGATVISMALRQTILSGTSRESQYAFYAANTILECAYYWDIVGAPADDNGNNVVFPALGENQSANAGDAKCVGIFLKDGPDLVSSSDNLTIEDISGGRASTFYLKVKDTANISVPIPGKPNQTFSHEYCAEATVTKVPTSDYATTGNIKVTISAKGYNTCNTSNPRRVERGLIQDYII